MNGEVGDNEECKANFEVRIFADDARRTRLQRMKIHQQNVMGELEPGELHTQWPHLYGMFSLKYTY